MALITGTSLVAVLLFECYESCSNKTVAIRLFIPNHYNVIMVTHNVASQTGNSLFDYALYLASYSFIPKIGHPHSFATGAISP